MNLDIIQKLNKLKNLEPDKKFTAYCRNQILETITPKTKMGGLNWAWPIQIHWPAFAWAGAITTLILVVFASYSVNRSNNILNATSFDSSKLNKEFNDLTINIQLDEISYQQIVNQTIASALTEISENKIKHLNTSVLEKEQKNMLLDNPNEDQIDELLKKIMF